jgi:hypothetical protein
VGLLSGAVDVLVVLTIGWVILLAVVWLHHRARALVGPAVRLVPDLVGLVRFLLGDPSTPKGSVPLVRQPRGFDLLRRLVGI